MAQSKMQIDVRNPTEGIGILDVRGELTGSGEDVLFAAYRAAGSDVKTVLLNLSGAHAVDSRGAGLLIMLLARARHERQRLLAYGLNDAFRRAFELTHLDEAVGVYADEARALESLQSFGERKPEGKPTAQPKATRTSASTGGWADPVARLHLPPVARDAINTNAEGRRPTGPIVGFGSLWRRTYSIRLADSAATPAEVVRVWKDRFGSLWPPAGRFYGADKPIDAGDMALLNLAGPAGLTIAEGILVIYADDESFGFVSAEGHMFGGMITFSAHAENGTTVAQVDALLRASDPLFEITVRLGIATKPEDDFWQGTLKNLAAFFGVVGQPVSQQAVLLDRSLQWSKAKNIWYNGAIRSALHTPLRWLRRPSAR